MTHPSDAQSKLFNTVNLLKSCNYPPVRLNGTAVLNSANKVRHVVFKNIDGSIFVIAVLQLSPKIKIFNFPMDKNKSNNYNYLYTMLLIFGTR